MLGREFFYKIRSFLDHDKNGKDFSVYIQILKKISPLTVKILGEEFLIKTLPQYFLELRFNEDNIEENLFYLPLFLKKYQTRYRMQDSVLELMDYESVCYQILSDNGPCKNKPRYTDMNMEVYINPLAQVLQQKHDIHHFVQNLKLGKTTKEKKPEVENTLLIISKNSETNELVFLKGNINHAAALDELHDGKMVKKDLVSALQNKFPQIAQRDWVVVLKELKENFIVCEEMPG